MAWEPFGTRLRSWREHAGMSQTQLADAAGVDQGALCRWERGLGEPEIAAVERLAVALGMSAVELLTGRRANSRRRAIRLTADKFAQYLPSNYAASLVKGCTVPADGIDPDDWLVSKLLAWVELQNAGSPDVRYEI